MELMSASPTLVLPPTSPTAWNWRAELETIESRIDHVAAGDRWDWRQDLRKLQTELEQLEQQLGR
jgi:hypothetical protein